MDRDEAIARGLEVRETRHSMKRRSPWHDYHEKGTYMLTLVVEGRMPLLGRLEGRVNARPGDGDAPKVMLSELGTAIVKEEIPKIHRYYPQVEVWKVCIMPDHVHLFIEFDPRMNLHKVIKTLKGVSSHKLREEFPYLKSRIPSLWTRSYFSSTVGHVSEETVQQYIESQKRCP